MIGNLREQDELTSKAARLLADGNALDAFRVAERLCRHYRRPDARHFLLRAQASIELRDVLAARADLHRAMDIDPTDAAIADTVLRMARDSDVTLLRRAASTIVASPRSSSAGLAAAIDVLAPSSPVIAQCRLMENRLEGWVTWAGGDRISGRLRRSDGSDFELPVLPEAGHELASSARKAATLSRSVPADSLPHLTWWIEDDASAAKAMTTISAEPPIAALRRPGTLDDDMATATKGVGCSVVVPIYDDAMATARCLDSLAAQTMDLSLTIIMVNDRPGDETMNILTSLAAKRFGFKLIVNAANLGFVEAVKRGIAAADTRDDIILLNADTVLPARALARLSAAAYSRRDIGTVTPLSNDGELTSFPNPNKANRLGDLATVQDLDATAQRVNIGRVVTLPNGVGFCLYVKRACLDAIGGVPDAYHRGYFEDVELCLRARFAGYKNVCATDVYVGHAGSRSFKEDKKVLVARNAKILKSRFPRFLEDGLAFVKADPLREAREAIAWASRRTVPRSRLVICASPRSFALHHRLKRLRGSRKKVFTLARTSPPRTSVFAFSSVDSEFHHDSVVDLARDDDRSRLLARIRQVGITCVEIIDDPGLEPAFATALQAQFPVRWILDEAPLSSIGEHVLARTSDGSGRTATRHRRAGHRSPAARLGKMKQIVALNPMVAALLSERNITHSRQNAPRPRRTQNIGAGDALGVVYPQASAAGDTLLRMLVAKTGGLPIVIIGQTFSDAAFMAHPSVYVTGHVDNGDYKTTVERYRVGLLVSIERRGGFALLSWLSAITGRRAAYFDASLGIMAEKDGDLGLSPAIGDSEAIDKLLAWAEAYLRGDVDDK